MADTETERLRRAGINPLAGAPYKLGYPLLGIPDYLGGYPGPQGEAGASISPAQLERFRSHGALGYLPSLLRDSLNSAAARGNEAIRPGISSVLGALFGQSASAAVGGEGQQAAADLSQGTPRPFLGLGAEGRPSESMQGSITEAVGGGGGRSTSQGVPFPEPPNLLPPNINVNALYDPVLAQLQDPERVKGPSRMEGLASILGGAAQGAMQGLQTSDTGAVFAGAGAGAALSADDLRREEQALQLEHQRAVQQMQVARAGVLSEKAGATMSVEEAIANTQNAELQLHYNHGLQKAMAAQPKVTPLGGGYYREEYYDPDTGQIVATQYDAVPSYVRAMDAAYKTALTQARIAKASGGGPKLMMDGKAIPIDAMRAAMLGEHPTHARQIAWEQALRLYNDPAVRNAYALSMEEHLGGDEVANAEMAIWNNQPEEKIFANLFFDLLEHPEKGAAMGSLR